jgi:hypothetical protein
MIKIAHRGNYDGRNVDRENTPDYVNEAISAGYNVLVDAWLIDKEWMLGADFPLHKVHLSFFERPEVWVRARNLVGYVSLFHNHTAHVFWQHKDDFTFTSKCIKWANKNILTHDGVMVFPEFNDYYMQMIRLGHLDPLGVCSDDFRKF